MGTKTLVVTGSRRGAHRIKKAFTKRRTTTTTRKGVEGARGGRDGTRGRDARRWKRQAPARGPLSHAHAIASKSAGLGREGTAALAIATTYFLSPDLISLRAGVPALALAFAFDLLNESPLTRAASARRDAGRVPLVPPRADECGHEGCADEEESSGEKSKTRKFPSSSKMGPEIFGRRALTVLFDGVPNTGYVWGFSQITFFVTLTLVFEICRSKNHALPLSPHPERTPHAASPRERTFRTSLRMRASHHSLLIGVASVAPPGRRVRLLSMSLPVFRFRSWLRLLVRAADPPLHPRPRRSNTHDGVFRTEHTPAAGRGHAPNVYPATAAASSPVPWISRNTHVTAYVHDSLRRRRRVARHATKRDPARTPLTSPFDTYPSRITACFSAGRAVRWAAAAAGLPLRRGVRGQMPRGRGAVGVTRSRWASPRTAWRPPSTGATPPRTRLRLRRRATCATPRRWRAVPRRRRRRLSASPSSPRRSARI